MKRSVIEIAIGVSVAVVVLSCADNLSKGRPTTAGPAVGEKAEIVSAKTEFAGTVGKMDVVIGLITVEHWPLSRTFKVPPECQIDILTNANAVLAELKVGEAVVVTYSEAGKDLVASRIVRQGKEYEQERKEKMERLDEMLNPSPNQ